MKHNALSAAVLRIASPYKGLDDAVRRNSLQTVDTANTNLSDWYIMAERTAETSWCIDTQDRVRIRPNKSIAMEELASLLASERSFHSLFLHSYRNPYIHNRNSRSSVVKHSPIGRWAWYQTDLNKFIYIVNTYISDCPCQNKANDYRSYSESNRGIALMTEEVERNADLAYKDKNKRTATHYSQVQWQSY